MKKFIISTLLLVICTFGAFAQAQDKYVVPQQSILGAEIPVVSGEMVILEISPVKSEVKYLKSIDYRWKVLQDGQEKRILVWPDNTKVFFSANGAKGKVYAFLAISYMYQGKDDAGNLEIAVRMSDIKMVEIKFDGPAPPPPDPNPPIPPTPVPDPIFPPGRYDLAKQAYDAAMSRVDRSIRLKSSSTMSSAFTAIQSAIAAGTITKPADVLKQTNQMVNSNLTAAGVSAASWESWDTVIQQLLYDLNQSGKMITAKDFGDAWGEIALGLNSSIR